MPLNTQTFNVIQKHENGAGIVGEYEKLLAQQMHLMNRDLFLMAWHNPEELVNAEKKITGLKRFNRLKQLAEFLDIDEDPFMEEPQAKARAILSVQNKDEINVRAREVGLPTENQEAISNFMADSIQDWEEALGGFAGPGVSKSLDLFLRNYMMDNVVIDVKGLENDPNFAQQSSDFLTLIEAKEQAAEANRVLNNEDTSELQSLADANGWTLAEQFQDLQTTVQTAKGLVNQVIAANQGSLVTRSYTQSIDSNWLRGEIQEVNERTFSLISDDQWGFFMANEDFTADVRDYYENNRDQVELAYSERGNKAESFTSWYGTEYAPQVNDIVERYSVVSLGTRPDRTLDPLMNEFLSNVPAALRGAVRERLRQQLSEIQLGPGQDKTKLWVELLQGDHGETPTDIANRYVGDLISSRPGGPDFVEAAREANLSLMDMAGDTQDPVAWIKSITDTGTLQGMPPVSAPSEKTLNLRAWVIEMFAYDSDMKSTAQVVREEIYTESVRQLSGAGFDPMTSENQVDYQNHFNNVIGSSNIKANVLERIVRNSSAEGDELWEDLKRQQLNTGSYAPEMILHIFNGIDGLDKDTLLIDNLNAQLEVAAKELGPSAEEAALAGFAEKTRNLPTSLQGPANSRIQSFLNTFVGEDSTEVLAREEVQDRIALIVEGVTNEFLGGSEVVDLAVSAFGGLNEFFGAFPDLQETDLESIQDFVVENFDTILESAGPDAEVLELQKAKLRVDQDKKTDELRERRQVLNNEAESLALEFDESNEGKQLAASTEAESQRQQTLQVFQPELERAVRGRIAGPQASQVLADVGPGLQRQFLAERSSASQLQAQGIENAKIPTAADFLGNLDDDFFTKERRRSNIRRTNVNVAAPQHAGLGAGQGPGFTPHRGGL